MALHNSEEASLQPDVGTTIQIALRFAFAETRLSYRHQLQGCKAAAR